MPYFITIYIMTSNEIRDTFLKFFKEKGHVIVPSAPMLVKDDPTLMFTNAGMNQFKNWFLGNSPIIHKRVADTQKCLRVSGKHNDLEEVGMDTYHHTMFEMLGNWSFGDYFKKEAIAWAWELLTEVFKIDKERLYATVFEGYGPDGLSMDTEAREAWLEYLPQERVLPGNRKDNFWEMGETGPCGPCSEIHIDLRSDSERAQIPGAEMVNKGNPQVIEIWNLVFMQFNRKANGELVPLPQKHVDTGMGLERLCMVLQHKTSSYDTDIFQSLISKISQLSGKKYGESKEVSIAMRVLSDHIRAISFSIADGQLPSNVKAGYVIRRILRRAVRYAYTFLSISEPVLYRLVPTLVEQMGGAFPEIVRQQQLIEKVIKEEEEAFLKTLDKGIKLIESIMEKNRAEKSIDGKDAFTLYDTYGFPIDLTELIAKEHGYVVDLEEFEKELKKQKERSRNATAKEEGDWVEIAPSAPTCFLGYGQTVVDGASITIYRSVKIWRISDDAIREIISCYTRESGVRNLERAIGEICRKTDMQLISQEESKRISVTGSNLETFLGVRKYLPDRLPCTDEVGLVTGLAWTSVGGETLEVEVNVMDGSGKLELTGNLGDVMKESAHAALSYIRANAQKLGVAPDFYKTKDIHVHFPEGAVPKDGPSAGVTVCTAMVSALTGVSVRRDVAMTGEISLRGRVMRIGGLKEKTMAALRHGVRTVIIPKDNERDLEEIDQTVRRQLNFISAQTVDTVLEAALNRQVELRPGILTELPEEMASKTPKPGLQQ